MTGFLIRTTAARSGMAVEFGIFVAGGVIDPDYRGPIQVNDKSIFFNKTRIFHDINLVAFKTQIILHNASYHSQTYAENTAIAQLIFERFDSESSIEQVEFFANDGSARGWGKFGSTGRVQPLRDSVVRGEEEDEEEDIAEVTREKLGLNCG